MPKFFYKNCPLIQYCKEKGLSYQHIVQKFYADSEHRPIDYFVEHYSIGIRDVTLYKTRSGEMVSLSKYCRDNGIGYKPMKEKMKLYPNLNLDELKELKIEIPKKEIKYVMFKGKKASLNDVCISEGLNYTHIIRNSAIKNITIQESFDKIYNRKVERWKKYEEWKKNNL